MNYNELKTLYVTGIIAYIKDKNVYVMYTRNMLQSITRLLEDYKDYEILVLEREVPEDLLKVRHKFWIEYYKGNGYTILNKRPPVNYKIKIIINKLFKVEVWLYPAHSTRTLLGTFDYLEDAQLFASEQSKKYEIK